MNKILANFLIAREEMEGKDRKPNTLLLIGMENFISNYLMTGYRLPQQGCTDGGKKWHHYLQRENFASHSELVPGWVRRD